MGTAITKISLLGKGIPAGGVRVLKNRPLSDFIKYSLSEFSVDP